MNKLALVTTLLILSPITALAEGKTSLATEQDKFSYAFGINVGRAIKSSPSKIDVDTLVQGVEDVINERKLLLSDDEAKAVQVSMMKKMQEARMEERKKAGAVNLAAGKAFLDTKAKEKDVKKTASGLLYKVVKQGEGAKPTPADTVKVHYKGTLIDGEEFDSSYKRGTPAQFQVTGVIKGWQEALQLMPAGSKYEVYIPHQLAYGENGQGQKIGPSAALVFEIELLEIVKKS